MHVMLPSIDALVGRRAALARAAVALVSAGLWCLHTASAQTSAASPAGAATSPVATSPAATVPARLQPVLAAAQAQGFAGEVLVADAHQVWFEHAVGLAQRSPELPHRVGAVWRWGSVSKQVTTTLAMQLVDEGALALDDTLALRWPAFSAPGAAQITVRHLMQHLSGLAHTDDSPRDANGIWSFYQRSGPPWQPEALRFCAGPARTTPGTRFQYGDCDTLVLAGLLEHLTGKSIPQLLQERLVQPLQLRSLRLNEGTTLARAVPMDAKGVPVPQPVMATYGAAGAMEGTARDLLAFNRALMDGQLVSTAGRQALWTGDPRWGYAALGVWAFPAPLRGCAAPVDLVERRGYVGGVQARNILVPSRGLSVVMFSNQAEFDFGEIWQGKGLSHDVLAAALCPPA